MGYYDGNKNKKNSLENNKPPRILAFLGALLTVICLVLMWMAYGFSGFLLSVIGCFGAYFLVEGIIDLINNITIKK
ncbi:MAG: hypothetical protein Q8934_08775 [Bacillota bacterium]|nr:hypothetical protein [Bacillota bacterium]